MLDKPDGSEGPQQAGEMCRQEPQSSTKGEVQSPEPGKEQLCVPVHAVGQLAGKQVGGKTPQDLGRHKVECEPATCPCNKERE